jgi:hypothetical protein
MRGGGGVMRGVKINGYGGPDGPGKQDGRLTAKDVLCRAARGLKAVLLL